MPPGPVRERETEQSSTHLAAGLGLLVLVPLLLLASVVYVLNGRLHESDLRVQLERLADVRHDWVQTHIHSLEHRARLVADQAQQRFSLAPPPPPGSAERQELEDFLAQAQELDVDLLGVVLRDADGRRVLTVGALPDEADRLAALTYPSEGPLILLDSAAVPSGLVEHVVVPLRQGGEIVGGIDLYYSGEGLLEIATAQTGLGRTGEAVLGVVDALGTLRFVAPTRFDGTAPMVAVGSREERLPLEAAIDGVEAYLEDFTDYRGVSVVAYTRRLESTGWGLVMKMDQSEAVAPVADLRTILLLGTGAVGTIVLLIALGAARRLRRDRRRLLAANERLRRAIVLNPFPAMTHGDDGEVLLVSDAWLARTGYGRDDLRTIDDWTRLAHGADAPAVQAFLDTIAGAGSSSEGVFEVRAKSGDLLVWSVRSIRLGTMPDGRQAHLSMAVDLTERVRLVERLQTTMDRLDATLDATPIPLFYLDVEGKVRRWNPAAQRVFGWREDEVLGRVLPIVPEDRLDEFHGFRKRVLAGEELGGAETMRRTKDGTLIPIRAHGAVVSDPDGSIDGIVGLAEDIRETRRHEDELRAVNRALTFVSACNAALVGDKPRSELLGNVCRIAIETGGYAHIWIHFRASSEEPYVVFQRSGEGVDVELPTEGTLGDEIEAVAAVGLALVTRGLQNGDSAWERALAGHGYSALAVIPFPEGSDTDGFVALAHERPDALTEEEVSILEELVGDLAYGLWVSSIQDELFLIRHAISGLTVGVSILDARSADSPLVFVNRGFTETTGYPPEEALGQPWDFLHGEETDPDVARELADALREGRKTQVSIRCSRKDGTHFWNRVTLEPIHEDDGTIGRFVAIQEDVTEQRRLGEELEHRSRLSAVGELAGGVAHDFRNILTASQGLLELALAGGELDPEAQDNLAELERLMARGTAVTDRLLALSRRSPQKTEPLRLHDLIDETSSLVSHTLRDDIVFENRLPEVDDVVVYADSDGFTHVILNLVRNAVQAMPDGGRLALSGDYPIHPEEPSWWPIDLSPETSLPWVRVTVADTGSGMDPETLERAFDPYFTTKPSGEGTGLGLPAVYGTVEAMGGRIWLDSRVGEGTEAHILLPTAEAAEDDAIASREMGVERVGRASRSRRTGTILLAEDDPSVLDVFTRALKREGHTVLTAEDGEDALGLFREQPDQVDLLVTDGMMPRMSGGELAREVWRLRPDLAVVVTSGFDSGEIRDEFPEEPPGPLLFRPKPLSMQTLIETVRTLLSDDGDPHR